MRNGNGHLDCAPVVEPDDPQLARNHYFTAKLLVERDFTDEQRYFIGKDRRHNRYLHGWGVVCGAKVVPHPSDECRTRYVVVEPGVAVDCHGREILVQRRTLFDVEEALERASKAAPDDREPEQPETFRICLRYAECPTEETPSLYDECGCSEDGCQPSRILESFELDVMLGGGREARPVHGLDPAGPGPVGSSPATVDPAGEAAGASSELLQAIGDLPDRGVIRAAMTAAEPKRAFVLSKFEGTGWLRVYDAPSKQLLHEEKLDLDDPADVAASVTGHRVYVVGSKQLHSYDATSAGTLAQVAQLDVPEGREVDAAGRGIVWVERQHPDGARLIVARDDEQASGAPTVVRELELPQVATDLAVSPRGAWCVVVNGSDLDLYSISHDDRVASIGVADSATAVALAEGPGDELVAYLGDDVGKLWTYRFTPGPDAASTGIRSEPIGLEAGVSAVAATPVYVLAATVSDTAGFALHVVDRQELEVGGTVFRQALPLQRVAHHVVAAADAPAVTVGGQGDEGAASVFVAVETPTEPDPGDKPPETPAPDCCRPLAATIDDCPGCECDEECVVLATITREAGGPMDEGAIDNLRGRRILPSVQVLTEIVTCLCAQIAALRRPPSQRKHSLPGLSTSFERGAALTPGARPTVRFGERVRRQDLNEHSVRILSPSERGGRRTWSEVVLERIEPLRLETDGDAENGLRQARAGEDLVEGVRLVPKRELGPGDYRIELVGDLIADERGKPTGSFTSHFEIKRMGGDR